MELLDINSGISSHIIESLIIISRSRGEHEWPSESVEVWGTAPLLHPFPRDTTASTANLECEDLWLQLALEVEEPLDGELLVQLRPEEVVAQGTAHAPVDVARVLMVAMTHAKARLVPYDHLHLKEQVKRVGKITSLRFLPFFEYSSTNWNWMLMYYNTTSVEGKLVLHHILFLCYKQEPVTIQN